MPPSAAPDPGPGPGPGPGLAVAGSRGPAGGMVGALGAWAALIAVVVVWGAGIRARPELKVRAAPFFGRWEPDVASFGALVGVAIAAIVVVSAGPRLAERLPWRAVVAGVALVAVGWLLALNAVDGPGELSEPLRSPREYVAGIPDVAAAGGARGYLEDFTDEIDAYPTHVRGHPPGLVVGLWALDDAGVDPVAAGLALALAGWAAAVVSALVALRATAGEDLARRAAPFLALLPGAIWAGTSFDAVFAGVVGVGVAAIVVATARPGRHPLLLAGAGGVAVGGALLLSYSVAPLLVVPIAVALRCRRPGPLVVAGAAAAAVLVVMGLVGGFWWPDGLAATREQYHAGVASLRPLSYFVVANLAVVAVSAGPAVAAGAARVGRQVLGPGILVAGAVAAVVGADLSGLTKAEVERIWLPLVPWLATATAFVPELRWRRGLLAAQALTALVVQVGLRSPW